MSMPPKESRYLLIAILAGILIRMIFLNQYTRENPFFGYPVLDSAFYLDWADAILEGRTFFKEEYHHPPAYAFFLAGTLAVFHGNLYGILLLQNLLVALQSWIVFRSARVTGTSRSAWVSFAFFTFCGPVLFYSMKILSETLYTTFLLISYLFILFYSKIASNSDEAAGAFARRSHRLAGMMVFFSGFFLGLAVETRGNGLICLLPASAVILFTESTPRRKGFLCGLLLLGLAIVMAPVLLRNIRVAGAWSAVSSNWGENFYFANHGGATGSFSSAPGIGLNLIDQIRDIQKEASRRMGRPVSSNEAQRFWFMEGLRFIQEQPIDWLKLELEKLRRLFRWREASSIYFYELESKHFQPELKFLFVDFGLLVLIFWVGLLAIPEIRGLSIPLGFLVAQTVLLLLFWPELRFCIPLIPFLCVVCGNIVFLKKDSFRQKRTIVVVAGLGLLVVSNIVPARYSGREAWYTNASSALFSQGEIHRAVEMARAALTVNPNYADAWVNLGAALAKSGSIDEARKAWQNALQLKPEDVVSLRNLALSYENEDREAAIFWWKKTLSAAHKIETSPKIIGAIEQRIRDLQSR